ncbi:MAG: radical SAM protein [Candidatus Omnitrophica bacterium]|nr:radical SAM protein [Candidatus Omnitrophota bacterium]
MPSTLKRLEFHISYACPNNCLFCSERAQLNKFSEQFIEQEEIKQKLKQFSKNGFNHVSFTGGEPSLHPQFISLADFSKRLGYRTYVTTNGGLFRNKIFCRQASRYLDEICFSVHGHTPELHNFHTRNRDSFRRLKRGIENIESSPYNILGFANIVVTRHNFASLERIISFIGNYNKIKQVLISNFAPEGQGLYNFRDLVVPLGKFRRTIPQLVDASLKRKISPRFFGLPLCILKGYEDFSNDLHWSPRVTLERCRSKKRICLKKTLSYKPVRGRLKTVDCKYCQRKSVCGGLFGVYYKEFGAGELSPLNG